MNQQYGDFRLVDPVRRVFDGNEHLSVSDTVGITRVVESQGRPVTDNAGPAVDRCLRNHADIIAAQRSRSETHNPGASWD